MATAPRGYPFGQPIITRDVTMGTRTPFADALRNKYTTAQPTGGSLSGSTPMNRGMFRPGAPGGTLTSGASVPIPGWNSNAARGLGGARTYPGSGGVAWNGGGPSGDAGRFNQDWGQTQPSGDVGRFNQDFGGGGVANPYTAMRPAPSGDVGRFNQDFGGGTTYPGSGPLNNLTPRFDPNAQRAPDNPWGRSGNINQGLHGLLAQLLGGRSRGGIY